MVKVRQLVWVVDDDVVNRFLYDKLLATHHHVVRSLFVNGSDARSELLKSLADGHLFPDIIFLDKDMPVMNGWQFLDWYQTLAVELRCSTKIIMATAALSEDDKLKAQRYACLDLCMQKPVTLDMLLRAWAAVNIPWPGNKPIIDEQASKGEYLASSEI